MQANRFVPTGDLRNSIGGGGIKENNGGDEFNYHILYELW
jgi:hypothetical protein